MVRGLPGATPSRRCWPGGRSQTATRRLNDDRAPARSSGMTAISRHCRGRLCRRGRTVASESFASELAGLPLLAVSDSGPDTGFHQAPFLPGTEGGNVGANHRQPATTTDWKRTRQRTCRSDLRRFLGGGRRLGGRLTDFPSRWPTRTATAFLKPQQTIFNRTGGRTHQDVR